MAGSIIRNKPVQTEHIRDFYSLTTPPTLLSVTPAKNNTRLIIFIWIFPRLVVSVARGQ